MLIQSFAFTFYFDFFFLSSLQILEKKVGPKV